MSLDHSPVPALDFISDTICPWCYIGKRRLEAALALLGDEFEFLIRWRPFELNPDMPRDGLSRKAYRSRKFGSWERSLALDAQVAAAAAGEGLAFRHDLMDRTPNTLASHVLVRIAGDSGMQGTVVEALFKAYFTEGLDVGDVQILTDIGSACGLDPSRVAAAVVDEALLGDVAQEAGKIARSGMHGVPTVMFDGNVLFSGAQPPEMIASSLRRVMTSTRASSVADVAHP